MDEQVYKFYEENKEIIDQIIDVVVSNHPDIMEAKSFKEEQSVKTAFDDFVKDFPDEGIANIEDFSNMENSEMFLELLNKGLDFKDAYKLANFNNIIDKKSKSASANTATKLTSKEHLKPTGRGNVSDSSVPSDVMNMYKTLVRDWSDEKIRRHFNKNR